MATIAAFVSDLAARAPAPGGGAAAAVAAALGAAAGAMAARYTTGPKWPAVTARAEALAATLDAAAAEFQLLAERDAASYAQVQAVRKAGGDVAAAEAAALAVPVAVLARCADAATALADFLPVCNPNLASDVRVGVHLLAGAGRAAWRTVQVNRPGAAVVAAAQAALARLDQAEQRMDGA